VGYTGGATEQPTYTNLGDHTETVEIGFDPHKVTFEQLLEVFWQSHSPTSPPSSRQYMSAIFYHDTEQRRAAAKSKSDREERIQKTLYTRILPASTFYMAEAYHQKYRLRRVPFLFSEMEEIYPTAEELVGSTAAARLNGYVAGYGTLSQLDSEIGELGLSAGAREKLRQIVAGR
jgi:methionine-S-sulfoxide reductase